MNHAQVKHIQTEFAHIRETQCDYEYADIPEAEPLYT